MTTKKIILISIATSILFFMIGWLATPALQEYIATHLIQLSKEVNVIATNTNEQLYIRLKNSLSLAMVPVFTMLTALAMIKIRNKYMSNWDFFFYFSIIFTVYLIAAVFKFYALEATVTEVLNHPISSSVKSILPLAQAQIYDWAFYGSIIAAVLIGAVGKRKKQG